MFFKCSDIGAEEGVAWAHRNSPQDMRVQELADEPLAVRVFGAHEPQSGEDFRANCDGEEFHDGREGYLIQDFFE